MWELYNWKPVFMDKLYLDLVKIGRGSGALKGLRPLPEIVLEKGKTATG